MKKSQFLGTNCIVKSQILDLRGGPSMKIENGSKARCRNAVEVKIK